jgi:small subunit ribosomal protein S17e
LGKAVPKGLKSKAESLIEMFPDKFSEDFEANKKVITEDIKIPLSKVNRNIIAAYIGRIKKEKKKTK